MVREVKPTHRGPTVIREEDGYTLRLSKTQMVHLRRLLNRAVKCCEGRCPQFEMPVWYYIGSLVEAIENAMKLPKRNKRERVSCGDDPQMVPAAVDADYF